MRSLLFIFLSNFILVSGGWCQDREFFFRHLHALAHDSLEGRAAGTEGALKAARYIRNHFEQMGLLPFRGDYFHAYSLRFVKEPEAESTFLILHTKGKTVTLSYPEVKPATFSASDSVKQLRVYLLGYGFKTPRYKDYERIPVSEPFVAVFLDGIPPWVDSETRNDLRPLSFVETKVKWAMEAGARAAIVVLSDEELARFSYPRLASKSLPIPVIYLSRSHFEKWFAPPHRYRESKVDWETWNRKNDLPKMTLSVHLKVEERTDYNVIAYLPSQQPGSDSAYVLIGAHYDHLGRGLYSSLADAHERQAIHNGADDNASGVVMMLALAHYLSNQAYRTRPLLFCAWGGEELGLLGSQAFVNDNPDLPIACYLNFDMVGRLKAKWIVQGTGSSPQLDSLIRSLPFPVDSVEIELQPDPMLPTDATSFYLHRVPVLSFFTGIHEDYHKPSDDVEKINFAGMEAIFQYVVSLLKSMVTVDPPLRPTFQQYRDPHATLSQRTGFRVYIGTLPDYSATDVVGMKLAGVSPNSPAEKCGLQKGDVIIQIGKKPISNIYDYMEVLQTAEPGKPLSVTILRAGEKKRVKLIPHAR